MESHLLSLEKDLSVQFPAEKFAFSCPGKEQATVQLSADKIIPVLSFLKNKKQFDFLMDICGVDYEERDPRFDVVYHLFSSTTYQRLRLKVAVSESVDSVVPVFPGANWFEREAYDMFGILFQDHPFLHRILTHHQFEGHPLRKDYPADYQQHCSHPLDMYFEEEEEDKGDDLMPLNIGPSHPATHGTLRIMVKLDGERIEKANVEIGYLHRCFEKMAETHPYNQVIPYTDRLNYCSSPMNNVGYCKAVEDLMDLEIPPKAQAMRVILCEFSRIIDHIVCIGASAFDLGAVTGFFHLFAYRELIYDIFEKLCGARLTVSLTRIGGMGNDAPKGWFDDILVVCGKLSEGVNTLDKLLTANKIWVERTSGLAPTTPQQAIKWGYTGPCLRATGLSLDLRKIKPYYGYDQLDFTVPVGTTGDVYDRYLVRVEEMRQSISIIEQIAKSVPEGDYTLRDKSVVLPEKREVYGNIEGLMNHFMLVMKGLRPEKGEVYSATEAANGELGFYLVSDGSAHPYRLKVRPPCFAIYQGFSESIQGMQVGDVISTLGSVNIVAGELDR